MLTIQDWETINGCLHRLYRELDSEKHTRAMLEVLSDVVPADSVALQYADVHTPMDLSAITWPENHSTKEQFSAIARYSNQSPFGAYYLATWDARWKMITDFMPLEDFRKTELHRLALAPLGVNHQVFGVLGMVNGIGYAIAINRQHHAFTEREREMLNVIQPHLVTSFMNAATHTRAQNSLSQVKAAMETAPGAYGYFNREGQVVWLQERAQAWLKEFFKNEAWAQGSVPHSIHQLLKKSDESQNAPQQMEIMSATERLIICLGGSALGGWVMRLERTPKTPPSYFRPLPQLSERKNEVLRWMVEGKRNAEIATILNLSPRTVENHVQEILKDLLVENRATAIVRAMEYCAAVNNGMPPMSPLPPPAPPASSEMRAGG